MAEKLAHRIRAVLSERPGEFTIHDLVEPLHIGSYEEKARAKEAIKGLKRAGEIISVRPGVFRYQKKQKPFSMLARMWRGMNIKGSFTCRDIVILSGADKTHIHKYMMFLKAQGFIELVSKDRSYAKGLYRIADQDNAPLDHPRLPTKKKRRR